MEKHFINGWKRKLMEKDKKLAIILIKILNFVINFL